VGWKFQSKFIDYFLLWALIDEKLCLILKRLKLQTQRLIKNYIGYKFIVELKNIKKIEANGSEFRLTGYQLNGSWKLFVIRLPFKDFSDDFIML
jgi:hypothetical protein